MKSLYELKEIYKDFLNLIMESESEEVDEIITGLASIDLSIEEKADNYGIMFLEFDSEIEKIKKEEKRLYKKRKSLENTKTRMKSQLELAMIELDKRAFKTEHFNFRIQNNPVSLNIVNEEKIPKQYQKIVFELDKKLIKDDLLNGVIVDGAELKQTESVRIR